MKLGGHKANIAILCAGLLLLILTPTHAQSEEYPTKPINMVITFAPGGNVSATTRFLASKAEKYLGQPFVITNNGAGGGAAALAIVAKAKPDGYHITSCTSTGLVRIPQFRQVAYKLEDFVPIMHYSGSASGIVVQSSSPWKTLKELVEYARQHPGDVTYSTLGVGSPHHLGMEYIAKQEGIQWTHIPYPGSAPTLTAVLGGHVKAAAVDSTFGPHVKEGTLRLLATLTEKRMKDFPNAPTLRELGYDYINETVYMFAAPKGTPTDVVQKLHDAFYKAVQDPEFEKMMDTMQLEIIYRNSADTEKYLQDANVRLGKMIKELKIGMEPEKK